MRNKIMIFGLIFVGVGIGISLLLASLVTRPIEALVRDMDIVSRGDLNHATRPMTNDEIGLLAVTFNRMTANLREAQEKEREVNRLNSELNLAKEIHAKLMPDKLPNLPGYDIFTAYYCAKEVGGDYYDFFGVDVEKGLLGDGGGGRVGQGHPGFDGHGHHAHDPAHDGGRQRQSRGRALQDELPHCARHQARHVRDDDVRHPERAHARDVDRLGRSQPDGDLAAGHADARTGAAQRHRAGVRQGTRFSIGRCASRKLQLYKGDRVVLYTDGVVESMNEQREEWGDETFYKFVCDHAELPSKDFVRQLLQALDKHKGNAEQHDDITVTTFRIMS